MSTAPGDLGAVQADDALLDALGDPPPGDPPAPASRLAGLLAAWRRGLDATPLPVLVDVDTALALMPGRPRRPWRRPQRKAPRMDQRHTITGSTLAELREIVAAAGDMPADSTVRVQTRSSFCADGQLLKRVTVIAPDPVAPSPAGTGPGLFTPRDET